MPVGLEVWIDQVELIYTISWEKGQFPVPLSKYQMNPAMPYFYKSQMSLDRVQKTVQPYEQWIAFHLTTTFHTDEILQASHYSTALSIENAQNYIP